MKKLLLSLLCLPALFATAQTPRTVVKTNLLSPLLSTGSFAVERVLGQPHSVQLSGSFTNFFVTDIEVQGFSITPEYRYYLSEEAAPEGFHLGAFLRYQQLDYTIEGFLGTENTRARTYGGGIVLGKQWLLKDRITVDLFAGPAYYGQRATVKSDFSDELVRPGWYDGFGLRSGITLGYGFKW